MCGWGGLDIGCRTGTLKLPALLIYVRRFLTLLFSFVFYNTINPILESSHVPGVESRIRCKREEVDVPPQVPVQIS